MTTASTGARPRVSILTLCYQQGRYVRRTVESVLAQGYRDWEMIVVDNGSTDGTSEVVESYREARVTLLRKPHWGLPRMRENYGLALGRASGELVALLDGDDWWPPWKLEAQVRAFDDPEVAFSYGAVSLHDEEGRPTGGHCPPRRLLGRLRGDRLLLDLLTLRYVPYWVTTMVRRSALDRLGGFVQPGHELQVDYSTWLALLPGAVVRGDSAVLGCYRIRPGSVTRTPGLDTQGLHVRTSDEFLVSRPEQAALAGLPPEVLRRDRDACVAHYRGLQLLRDGRAPEALPHFREALRRGRGLRRLKAVGRMVQCLGWPGT
ncbi:MAG: glycosyltransferase family 2 protein [Planctomycetes bacterium]|nr:glycosyltransferase family 2 protein [Planctomycetota bacterium]